MNERTLRADRVRFVDREFHDIRELLEMLMSELSPAKHTLRARPNLGWAPPTDVYETETEFVVTMDIAGMDSSKISVVTDGKVLTIRGVRDEIAPRGRKHFHKLEIQVGPFQRHIQIPAAIESKGFFTNYANGLLEVRLKKKFDTSEKRRVDVE